MGKFEFKPRHAVTIQDVAGNNSIAVATRDVVKGMKIAKRSVAVVNGSEMVLLKLALPYKVKPIGGWRKPA